MTQIPRWLWNLSPEQSFRMRKASLPVSDAEGRLRADASAPRRRLKDEREHSFDVLLDAHVERALVDIGDVVADAAMYLPLALRPEFAAMPCPLTQTEKL